MVTSSQAIDKSRITVSRAIRNYSFGRIESCNFASYCQLSAETIKWGNDLLYAPSHFKER